VAPGSTVGQCGTEKCGNDKASTYVDSSESSELLEHVIGGFGRHQTEGFTLHCVSKKFPPLNSL